MTTRVNPPTADRVRAALLGRTWVDVADCVVPGIPAARVRAAILYLAAKGEVTAARRSPRLRVRLVIPGTQLHRPTPEEEAGLMTMYGLTVADWVALPSRRRAYIMSHVGIHLNRRAARTDPAYAAEKLADRLRGEGWVKWYRCQRGASVLGSTAAMRGAVALLEASGRLEVVRKTSPGGKVFVTMRLVEPPA